MIVHWLNDIYKETPWSFERTGELVQSILSENGAERKIELWYNHAKTGRIRLSAFRHRYRDGRRIASVELSLINGRAYPGYDVVSIGVSLAQLVGETQEAIHDARDQIQTAMIDAIWQVNAEFGNPTLELRFTGRLQDDVMPTVAVDD